mgnify:FL=1
MGSLARITVLARLAWRNLWRNRRRTAIMLGAIALGVWAMVFLTALTRGMVDQMIEDGISALPGHVQAHHPAFRDDPSIENLLPGSGAALDAALARTDLAHWATRVRVPAVVSSERETRGVELIGMDPARERGLIFLDYDAVQGRFLSGPGDDGLVLGRKLAETLETEIGRRVVIMSQDPDNEIADRGFRVVGLFDAELEAYEQAYAFTGRTVLQQMLGIGDRVSEVVVAGDDYRDVEAEYAALGGVMAEVAGDGAEVRRWTELDSYLGTMLDVMDGFVLVWVVVIFLALSFGLVNTLVMAVFERVREIGLMLALGMKPTSILGQILIESMLLLLIGLALGNALAWLTIRPMADGIDLSIVAEGMEFYGAASTLTPKLTPNDLLLANAVVLLLGFLASLSPAWRASRYDPVEAITKANA